MSIRLRLALQCGSICSLVLVLVALFSYGFHTRNHYDDLDRILLANADHAADEIASATTSLQLLSRAGENSGSEIILRYYGPDGTLRAGSLNDQSSLFPDSQAILHLQASPAFDGLAGLVPPMLTLSAPSGSTFGLATTTEARWRVFVLPLGQGTTPSGYVVALTSLERLDAWIGTLRVTLLALSVVGVIVMLAGLWIVAGRSLQPVTHIAQAARAISFSRDFSRRVSVPPRRDELAQLAQTFNAMLESLEAAYQVQHQFVADASHELRAPLTVIQGNLELVRRQTNMSDVERSEALKAAEDETTRLARLVSELLTLARADAGLPIKCYPVELDSLVLDVFHSARQLASGQTLTLEPFEPVSVIGDEDRLKQLLLVLLDNALKYTPPEGRVTLGLTRREYAAEITVQDTGIGIPADDLPRIFERFYRADPARSRDPGGTGLGLSIARWIVVQHGGQITVQSQVGQGTTFTVRLPLQPTAVPSEPVQRRTTGYGA